VVKLNYIWLLQLVVSGILTLVSLYYIHCVCKNCAHVIFSSFELHLIFRSLPGNDLLNSGPSVCPQIFSDFDLIWCVGRPLPDMRTVVTSAQSKVKVKVTGLLKF